MAFALREAFKGNMGNVSLDLAHNGLLDNENVYT